MVETQQSLMQAGISMFLSFGAKSVKPEILEKLLVGRQKTVDMLTQQATDIAESGANAQLMLIGNRGMGKTHVLRVLYHRIQPLIQDRKIVVAYFVEEAYDVASYLDFLVRIIKDFVRWYETDAELLQQKLSILRETPSYRQEELAEQIVANYVADKPLLILTENFDTILEALGKSGQAKLRSWLYRHNRISIMATAQALSPDLGREDRPFYQFFTAIYLKRLSYEDSLELLRSLAQTDQNQATIDHLQGKGIGQVRAIHDLVKGNHRLLVTFYEFLKADTLAKLSDIFMKTLNDLKPYYETYIRYLPPQQQKIVHYLALAVTPRNGTDIAKDCFIDSKSLSKQLSDLQRSHLLDAYTDPADGRNKLYDLSEPLLRISLAIGEHTQGITPLFIDFLANWHNINDLENQKDRFWQLHLNETNDKLKQDYLFDYEARVKAIDLKVKIGNESMIKMRENLIAGNWQTTIDLSENVDLKNRNEDYYNFLGIAFNSLKSYDKAIECYQKAIDVNPNKQVLFNNIGNTYNHLKEFDKALTAYKKFLEIEPNRYEVINNIGDLYYNKREYHTAILYYQKSVEINPTFCVAFYNLGKAHQSEGSYEEAIAAYQKTIETGASYIKNNIDQTEIEILKEISDIIIFILKYYYKKSHSDTIAPSDGVAKIQHLEKLIEDDYGLPDELKIAYLMLQTYRRYVLEKDKRAIYDLPKEQRAFFLREIVGEK
jgi:tetratricopeptide (TPR) repeat protein